MWTRGVIILPALFALANAQNLRNNWVGMLESKLSNRADKAQHIQDLDSTMLMKGSAMPEQSFTNSVNHATNAFKGRVRKMPASWRPFPSAGSIYRTAHLPSSSFANRIHKAKAHFPGRPFARADHNTIQVPKVLKSQNLVSAEKHDQQDSVLPAQKVALFLMVAHSIVHEAMMPSKGK